MTPIRRSAPHTRPHADDAALYRAVVGEGILLAGGGRALLLQLAHPGVARGVDEHSRFAADPMRRLVGTVGYLYTLAFGAEDEIREVARRVGGAHRGVRSEASPHAYDARDPDLQLWVAATLYDTTVMVYELAWGPLPDDAADVVYRRSARIGTALGMPAGMWPGSRDAFRTYWDERVRTLEVTPAARRAARELFRPRVPQPRLRPVLPLARIVTAGLLPEPLRAAYGVDWSDARESGFRRRLGLLVGVYRALPTAVRTAPARFWPR